MVLHSFQGNRQNNSFLMQSILLLLQTIRVESTLALSQIQAKTDNRFKETTFLFASVTHISSSFFSLWPCWSREVMKWNTLKLKMYYIWTYKNKFEVVKQKFIKYLTSSKTTVLVYFQYLYVDTKTEGKTLLYFFFDDTEEARSWLF